MNELAPLKEMALKMCVGGIERRYRKDLKSNSVME